MAQPRGTADDLIGSVAADVARFSEQAISAGRRAAERSDTVVADVRLGDRSVRFHLCGGAMLAHCWPALGDRATGPSGAVDHEIWAFDSVSSGVALPPPPWPTDAYRPRDEIAGLADGPIEATYALAPGSLSLHDKRSREGIFWTRDAERLPLWERAQPFRDILRWVARDQDLCLLHAAVVGDSRGAVLLTGRGGSGKSTAALACTLFGLRVLSDDMCLVSADAPLRVHGLFGVAKIDDAGLGLLPELRASVSGPERTEDGKAFLALSTLNGGLESVEGVPIRGLVLPRIAARGEAPVRVAPARALLGSGPTNVLELTGGGAQELALLGVLVRSLPTYSLAIGADVRAGAFELKRLLEQLG
jgi:hypothetical protein